MVGLFFVLYIGLVKNGFIERKLGQGNIRSGSVQINVIYSIFATFYIGGRFMELD